MDPNQCKYSNIGLLLDLHWIMLNAVTLKAVNSRIVLVQAIFFIHTLFLNLNSFLLPHEFCKIARPFGSVVTALPTDQKVPVSIPNSSLGFFSIIYIHSTLCPDRALLCSKDFFQYSVLGHLWRRPRTLLSAAQETLFNCVRFPICDL